MPLDGGERPGPLARQLGSLALSLVRTGPAAGDGSPRSPGALGMTALRAAGWRNGAAKLGVAVPLVLAHDLGLLLGRAGAPEAAGARLTLGVRAGLLERLPLPTSAWPLLGAWQGLLEELASSEVVAAAGAMRLRDELIAVLLARVLGDLLRRFDPRAPVELLPLDPALYADLDDEALARHFAGFDPAPLLGLLGFLVDNRLPLQTALESIDPDTLRLLGVFRDARAASALDLVDLHAAIRDVEAADVVDFSLELLPSVLETRRASAAQTFAVDGYASLERKGSLDSLLPTELAWDPDLFDRKALDGELYFYGRERHREQPRRLAYLLVDSSPSMRGVRQVFARGLALALAKKLQLAGDEVWFRFFDSRLYELQRFAVEGAAVPYLLCFKSERGRNYGRVFRQLLVELSRLRAEQRRPVTVWFVTHGQCHLPRELVEQLGEVARLHGVFILPSQPGAVARLEYLGALAGHQIVDEASLGAREARKRRALDILATAAPRDARPRL